MRGRKPKPTVLHKLHGSFNVTRHRARGAEPVASGSLDVMEPPADLNEHELATWHYAIEHAPRGVLKKIDRTLLTLWCKTAERYRRAEASQAGMNAQQALPDVIRAPSGLLMVSPYVQIMHKTALLMLKLAEQLGFTPISRPRLGASKPAPGDGDRWLKVMDMARVRPSNRP